MHLETLDNTLTLVLFSVAKHSTKNQTKAVLNTLNRVLIYSVKAETSRELTILTSVGNVHCKYLKMFRACPVMITEILCVLILGLQTDFSEFENTDSTKNEDQLYSWVLLTL